MISNLTEIIMCLHEETGDSTHERTGRGSWGAATELELRFSRNYLCSGNICQSETPDKESFFGDAKSYEIGGEILEAEKKMYSRFRLVHGLGHK